MKHIRLNTGAKMPMLGLGVFDIGDNEEGKVAIHTAIESGYRSIDTAADYNNEQLVGQVVRESGISRDEIFITTKLSNTSQRAGNVDEAIEQSLKNLGMDYVDLYLVHWPVAEHYVDTWLALEKFYRRGYAKAIGVSNFQPHHIVAIKSVGSVVPAINQIEIHPFFTQKSLMAFCKEEGILLEARSPLGGIKVKAIKDSLLNNKTIEAIGNKYNKSTAQIILRWNIDLGIVTIPKSITPSRIISNINLFDFCLTADEINSIDAINKNQRIGSDPDNFDF